MHSGNLHEILVLLVAAVFIVAIFKRLQLSPVLGYLVAGGAIGPFGLSIIQDIETTKYIAEFGVVFLLFAIGLELTLERLMSMRLHVFGFGGLQMLITGLLIGFIAYLTGVSAEGSVIIGGGLALSSTAIVLQLLAEKNERTTQSGRLAISALILQDLAVVPLLMLVPHLANEDANLGIVIVDSLFKTAAVLIVILVVGRRILRPLYGAISRLGSHELFIATTLLIVLGASWITHAMGMSLAMGAFIAGLLVAETEFRPQVEADIAPFKGLLMGLFFMTVGMSIDFILLLDKLGIIIACTIALIALKAVVIFLLAKAFSFKRSCSIQTGLVLAQGSEFAFVLFNLAAAEMLFSQEFSQMLLIIVSISMAVTPLLVSAGKYFLRPAPVKQSLDTPVAEVIAETSDLENHIVVIGFGRVGKTICHLLAVEDLHYYVALDSDSKAIKEGRKENYAVFYGDAENMETLRAIGIERARMVVVATFEKGAGRKIIQNVKKHYPNLPIVALGRDRKQADRMRKAGADSVYAEDFESTMLIGDAVLGAIGTPNQEKERLLKQFRQSEYPISCDELGVLEPDQKHEKEKTKEKAKKKEK